jgi:suppressor of G2 allele of SKP1
MAVVSAEDALKKANSLFVDENFEDALEQYNLAIELDAKNIDAYLKRSQCNTKLKNFTDALADANKAITLGPNNAKAFFRKGIACFELEEYETALAAFEKGSALDPSDQSFKTWIRKCKAEIQNENGNQVDQTPQALSPPPSQPQQPAKPSPPPATQPAPTPKIRHEWYQNPTHVFINIFAKGVKQGDLSIDIEQKSVSVNIKLSENNQYVLDLDLAEAVVPSESSYTIMSTKIEIKLKKEQALKWDTLEYTGSAKVHPWDSTVSTTPATSQRKNWDKLVKEEIGDEKLDGEEGLNKVFQDIYSNATEEQRRAMVKSFVESGGTVLSTNWDEVGKAPVKGSPPSGMEMRKWGED